MSRTLTHALDLRTPRPAVRVSLRHPGDVISGTDTKGRDVLGTIHRVIPSDDAAHGGATYVLKPGALVGPAYAPVDAWVYVDADQLHESEEM